MLCSHLQPTFVYICIKHYFQFFHCLLNPYSNRFVARAFNGSHFRNCVEKCSCLSITQLAVSLGCFYVCYKSTSHLIIWTFHYYKEWNSKENCLKVENNSINQLPDHVERNEPILSRASYWKISHFLCKLLKQLQKEKNCTINSMDRHNLWMWKLDVTLSWWRQHQCILKYGYMEKGAENQVDWQESN